MFLKPEWLREIAESRRFNFLIVFPWAFNLK